jgi:Na+/H+ antiporter NhaD/arsenite permease-like protein
VSIVTFLRLPVRRDWGPPLLISLAPDQGARVRSLLLVVFAGVLVCQALCLSGLALGQETATPAIVPPTTAGMLEPAAGQSPAHDAAQADDHAGDAAKHASLGAKLPLWTVIPFVALLLCIAILPLAQPHWWEHNRNKGIVAGVLAAIVAIYLLAVHPQHGLHELVDKLKEYASFIILLAALYVISGGIYIKGSLSGTPLANTILLAIGAMLASFIGTTGASVLLIRPLLRANRTRVAKAHIVVFFIFIVSNCGGLLTPLGDPPLFLGFLKGVPFLWTMQQLWREWLVVNLALLVIFHIYDEVVFAREERARHGSQLEEALKHESVGIEGALNFAFLGGIIVTIYCSGQFRWSFGVQEGLMFGLAVLAYLTTSAANRLANKFTFGPIIEVAVLFIGIFITMAPALQILNAWGGDERDVLGWNFGMRHPWEFFWASGVLSSFLDNAPTYLTFAATAAGQQGIAVEDARYLEEYLTKGGADAAALLAAVSCGAVFMGANTYIGNGPNFMVKAIAEENGVKMPSFFGYMAYSGAILIPLFIVVTLIFFRH